MLAGEAGRRQVFGRGGTADGDGDPRPVDRFELPIVLHQHRANLVGPRGSIDDRPGFGGCYGQTPDVIRANAVEQGREFGPGAARGKRLAICFHRQGKAVGHLHALP